MTTHEILLPHTHGEATRDALSDALADLEDATLTIAETPSETRDGFETATIAIVNHVTGDWLERADRLEWVQATSAGVDHYDTDAMAERGIVLTNASGIHGQQMGEHVLGSMLAFERELLAARDRQSEGVWLRSEGGELATKTVGVVGLGAIGGRVAELASAVGSTVIGTKRDPDSSPGAVDEAYGPDDLEIVLARSDYVVLAVPLTDETRGLIDGDALSTMKRSAVLVNVARGEVVDEDALVDALRQGRLEGAALDVFEEEPLPAESPLWDLPNVLVTPHVAGSTPHYAERVADCFRDHYERFVDGEREDLPNRIV